MIQSVFTNQTTLFEAKAFLCWDLFKELSIQLVPVEKFPAYFIPQGNPLNSIILFYHEAETNLSESLFLLFHEAGHVEQFLADPDTFRAIMNQDKGIKKQLFEEQAWTIGRQFLQQFLQKQTLNIAELLKDYDQFARQSINSYM